ncbi:MAG: ArsA-related P-loop ATPase [Acidobacteriota bacterium]
MTDPTPTLSIVVGAGGVGKTTLAAALAVHFASRGEPTLVMTFDPSLRLKDALGVSEDARTDEVAVELSGPGELHASLLDVKRTFDRLVGRYAPDEEVRARILANRFYAELSGTLAGVLEYMAVERLFEVAEQGRYRRIVLDTPPTRQALDFLEAPDRILAFLDSGALRIALKPWFDERGRLRPTSRLGFIGRNLEAFLDHVVGLELLRDMAEFFSSFGPLYEGFRERAHQVRALLRARQTSFLLVSGPGEDRVADTLFFARRLREAGHRLGPVIVNRVHPPARGRSDSPALEAGERGDGARLVSWLGERDAEGVAALRGLLGSAAPLVEVPLLPDAPSDLESIERLALLLADRLPPAPA